MSLFVITLLIVGLAVALLSVRILLSKKGRSLTRTSVETKPCVDRAYPAIPHSIGMLSTIVRWPIVSESCKTQLS